MSESGLEELICNSLVNDSGYLAGRPGDYDREHAVDPTKLFAFLQATQSETVELHSLNAEGSSRQKFLHRLQGEIERRGVIDVFRRGMGYNQTHIDFYFLTPTEGNKAAEELHAQNIFSVTRQLRYSRDETQLALDFAVFLNGLPVATFELKNQITKQTYDDAINQYKCDRDPRELLFRFGRCAVHFALDENQVWMCTDLKGTDSWFLPFNKGVDDGAGNPLNPSGLRTDYLWKDVLSKPSLSNILECFAQIIEEEDDKGRKKEKQIFPRYHQLSCVRELLEDAQAEGVGKRYLIQHSAGSGKSNSITWLAHQLVGLRKNESLADALFNSILVITDRVILHRQIKENLKQFADEIAVLGVVSRGSTQLSEFLAAGKKIIVTTVQTFPFALEKVGSEHRGSNFAIIIDEAHSSQGGRTAAKANMVLSETSPYNGEERENSMEDRIVEIIKARKMLPNASYFAFTATPKSKTSEIFGTKYQEGDETKYRPFHTYTMKQAIQEGFILDVLQNYTTADSYYRLRKTVENDPEFDVKKGKKKFKKFVESHDHAIGKKAKIMIDHFHDQVVAKKKIGGKARAMIVTSGIPRALQYKAAIDAYLKVRKSPFKAIIAFSGEHEYEGETGVTESKINGFASGKIAANFKKDPYRFLIVADKFQTGFDEPLLHSMYCDKKLSGIRAVQTLSRLNRAHPHKYDTFVLDFMNDTETIKDSFANYYRTTLLSEASDANKLHDLKDILDKHNVYQWSEVQGFVNDYLAGASRDVLEPLLEVCVERYISDLDEDEQIDFKSRAKAFVRSYYFLASILDWIQPNWERLATFLSFLTPKLPAPVDEDLAKGILQTIDMDSYRVEVNAQMQILLPDEDAEIDPANDVGGASRTPPEIDRLSSVIRTFNEHWGKIDWDDKDRIQDLVLKEIPARVATDEKYNNACKNSDKNTARIEHDQAYRRVMNSMMRDETRLFKQYADDEGFRNFAHDRSFEQSYEGKRDRLSPVYEQLLSYYSKVTGANVKNRWNQHAATFQRTANNVESLRQWIKAARVLLVEEMPLVPAAFGDVDIAELVRLLDDRLDGKRPPRYSFERTLCQGAGIKSLNDLDDSCATRVQDWLAKQMQNTLRECAATRSGVTNDEWKASLTKNSWIGSVEEQLQDAVQRLQQAHDALVEQDDGNGLFRTSARTEMAKSIGNMQTAFDDEIPDSDVIWKMLFQFGESITKVTSESLVERDGLKGVELLKAFKAQIGKKASQTLDMLFRLRCRGDHADDVSKRPEWEQSQHEVAKLLGRNKPRFKKNDSELLFQPDDLQLTALEGNELKILALQTLAEHFENCGDSSG